MTPREPPKSNVKLIELKLTANLKTAGGFRHAEVPDEYKCQKVQVGLSKVWRSTRFIDQVEAVFVVFYTTTYEQVTLFEIILVRRLQLQEALAFEQLKQQLNTTQKTVTDHELNSQKKAVNIWMPLLFYGHSLVTPKRCRQRYNKKWTGLCFKRTLRKPRSNFELLSTNTHIGLHMFLMLVSFPHHVLMYIVP